MVVLGHWDLGCMFLQFFLNIVNPVMTIIYTSTQKSNSFISGLCCLFDAVTRT